MKINNPYKRSLKKKAPLSLLLLTQSQLDRNIDIDIEKTFETDLHNFISRLQQDIIYLTETNFYEFNSNINFFRLLISELNDFSILILPFRQSNFPKLVLEIISKNFDQISQYSYFLLCLLAFLNDTEINNFLIQNNILDFCFLSIKKQSPYDFYLIDTISLLLPYLDDIELTNIINVLPFDSIFANTNRQGPQFAISIFELYKAIADCAQDIPHPSQFFTFLNSLKNITDGVLKSILNFFISMAQIKDLDLNLVSLLIQEDTIFKFITKSILASDDRYSYAIDFYNFCTILYKYLRHICKSDSKNKLALKLLNQISNIPTDLMIYSEGEEFEEEEEEEEDEDEIKAVDLSTILYLMNIARSYNSEVELAIIINYFKMFIKSHPHYIKFKKIKKICLYLFDAIINGAYELKLNAIKALSLIINISAPHICEFLLSNNIYDVFISGLSIDDEKIDEVVIDSICSFFHKFIGYKNFHEIVESFATPYFFEIINDVKERSEERIILLCVDLEDKINQMISGEIE